MDIKTLEQGMILHKLIIQLEKDLKKLKSSKIVILSNHAGNDEFRAYKANTQPLTKEAIEIHQIWENAIHSVITLKEGLLQHTKTQFKNL